MNSIKDLKEYLSTENNIVSLEEFLAFWDSCSEEEKQEFKETELSSSTALGG